MADEAKPANHFHKRPSRGHCRWVSVTMTARNTPPTKRRNAMTQAGSIDATATFVIAKEEPHVTTSAASVSQSLVVAAGVMIVAVPRANPAKVEDFGEKDLLPPL
jgi:hypothetical protein